MGRSQFLQPSFAISQDQACEQATTCHPPMSRGAIEVLEQYCL